MGGRRPITPSKTRIAKSSDDDEPFDSEIKYATPRKSTPEKKGDERPAQDATKCEVILTPVKSPIKEPFKEIFEERRLRESVDVKRLKDLKDDRETKDVKKVKDTKA